jgi:hypothetical protein
VHPVNGDIALDDHHQLMRDHPERRFSHHLPRALVFGQRVVEGDFLASKAGLLAAGARRADIGLCPSPTNL